jgi:hypothetical protein
MIHGSLSIFFLGYRNKFRGPLIYTASKIRYHTIMKISGFRPGSVDIPGDNGYVAFEAQKNYEKILSKSRLPNYIHKIRMSAEAFNNPAGWTELYVAALEKVKTSAAEQYKKLMKEADDDYHGTPEQCEAFARAVVDAYITHAVSLIETSFDTDTNAPDPKGAARPPQPAATV